MADHPLDLVLLALGDSQPADKGKLGDAEVIDVQINEGIVVHTVKAPLEKGTKVSGKVDFELRFE